MEEIQPGRLLRRRAEMALPGSAWLELRVEPHPAGSRYERQAIFVPRAWPVTCTGRGIAPAPGVVFGGVVRNIAAAERLSSPTA